MVLVRVFRITSMNDPETGLPGKQIELIEVRERRTQPLFGGFGGEDANIVKNIVSQFQSMGLVPPMREFAIPKVTLFLTEHEYDILGVRFEVNEVYDLVIKDGAMVLKKPSEGV